MKIWFGYGSDHSANLVMVGEFKTLEQAAQVRELIDRISEAASSDATEGVVDPWAKCDRYSEQSEELLRKSGLNNLSPSDISDFALLSASIEISDNTLRLRTDQTEIGGFVKLMVSKGARVQVYCADEYPDDERE